jgi:hypothetical protein
MFAQIGALWVDHVAVTTDRFEETAQHYLGMPNARVLRGPGWNSAQKVHFLFVSFGGDLCIEVLGVPEGGDSPIAEHARAGGGVYHICHAVADIDASVATAQTLGARLIVAPKADDAYDGRRVAFLMHPAHGLFELVEAYGSFTGGAAFVPPATPVSAVPAAASSDIETGLTAAFQKIFLDGLPKGTGNWTVDQIKRWDSLQHMRLIMEVERQFDTALPSHLLGGLRSFDDVAAALAQVT